MTARRSTYLIVLLALVSAGRTRADEPGLAFLKISSAAHSAPAGFSSVTMTDHPDAAFWNPAGLAFLHVPASAFSYGAWLQQIRFGTINAHWPAMKRHHFGISLHYMDLPGIERRSSAADREPIDLFTAANMALSVGWGYRPLAGVALGGSVKLVRQEIDREAGTGWAGDLGLTWQSHSGRVTLAAAARNYGPALRLTNATVALPRLLDAGLLIKPAPSLELGAGIRSENGNRMRYHLSSEWHSAAEGDLTGTRWALRVGYQFKDDVTMLKGVKAGAGLERQFGEAAWTLDYAWLPFNQLGVTHLFSLTLRRVEHPAAMVQADKALFSPFFDHVHFSMSTQSISKPQRWQLVIVDENGLMQRTFSGTGLPPASCTWQGRDSDERMLPDGPYRYRLQVVDGSGRPVSSEEKEIVLDGRPPDIRLQVIPRFIMPDDTAGLALLPALVKSQSTDFTNPVQEYTVSVLDRSRRVVQKFAGAGEPPQRLPWDLRTLAKPLDPGVYYAVATARDIVGNTGISDTTSFLVGFRLRPETRKTIEENVQGYKITLGNVLFDFDKSTLRPVAFPVLNNVSLILQAFPRSTAMISGHTDARGSEAYNEELSMRRSEEVRTHLIKIHGIDAARLTVQWFGKSQPVADNETEEGRQLNRRVEILINMAQERGGK